ncbi:Uu.00g142240.m01.CDS01 [Anthostomella pinea]|uniref:Uu.00g142240.m01.CDS01 n=1 Tax=Anthostomella pinea TaxID=933095 RepID=A0AAI8YLF2_9PEZI|nr:Uu.00g142240.m01.CDS01 [Anthostomella pinea]
MATNPLYTSSRRPRTFDENYTEVRQANTIAFQKYRQTGAEFERYPPSKEWENLALPVPNHKATAIEPDRQKKWVRKYWRRDLTKPDLDKTQYKIPAPCRDAWRWRTQVKAWLSGASLPDVKYVRTLDFTSEGHLEVLARHTDPITGAKKDFVVRSFMNENTNNWEMWPIRVEERNLKKLDRAAHIVQILDRKDVGLPAQTGRPDHEGRDLYDTTDSSEDETKEARVGRPKKRTRRSYMKAEIDEHNAAKNKRQAELRAAWAAYRKANGNSRDFLPLEYLPNGRLDELIIKIQQQQKPAPNRVPWSFWLCLVRACTAMTYPPRLFNEDREKPVADGASRALVEDVPSRTQRWRAKNMAHFALTLKVLARFHQAANIKSEKMDGYYGHKRDLGYHAYFAPEQFCNEWDKFGHDATSDEIARSINARGIAGNYGTHTNVWGIANIMFTLITTTYPPMPPQPAQQNPKIKYAYGGLLESHLSYGSMLLDDEWNHVDRALRETIVKCMCHNPTNRPTLEQLLEEAEDAQATGILMEADQVVRDWVTAMGLDTDDHIDTNDDHAFNEDYYLRSGPDDTDAAARAAAQDATLSAAKKAADKAAAEKRAADVAANLAAIEAQTRAEAEAKARQLAAKKKAAAEAQAEAERLAAVPALTPAQTQAQTDARANADRLAAEARTADEAATAAASLATTALANASPLVQALRAKVVQATKEAENAADAKKAADVAYKKAVAALHAGSNSNGDKSVSAKPVDTIGEEDRLRKAMFMAKRAAQSAADKLVVAHAAAREAAGEPPAFVFAEQELADTDLLAVMCAF